jgi:hypothetical protein
MNFAQGHRSWKLVHGAPPDTAAVFEPTPSRRTFPVSGLFRRTFMCRRRGVFHAWRCGRGGHTHGVDRRATARSRCAVPSPGANPACAGRRHRSSRQAAPGVGYGLPSTQGRRMPSMACGKRYDAMRMHRDKNAASLRA